MNLIVNTQALRESMVCRVVSQKHVAYHVHVACCARAAYHAGRPAMCILLRLANGHRVLLNNIAAQAD